MPILQTNFTLNVPADAYASASRDVAQAIADVPGLRWKIWLLNEREKEAGGLYFFETESALNEYLSGPVVGQLRNHPAITDVTVKRFDVLGELTSVTRGPVFRAATAQADIGLD